MVDVADLRKVELIPLVCIFDLNGVALVPVIDAIAKGVDGAGKLPGVDLRRVSGVSDDGGILTDGFRCAVDTHQPVFTPHLPVIIVRVAIMVDVGKQALGTGTIAPRAGRT